MSAFLLQARRSPSVDAAFTLAQGWCEGHIIDGGPALGHAVKVVNNLGRHAPYVPHYVVAAMLLHDSPDFAPREELVDRITHTCGAEVLDFIDHLHAEHQVLQDPTDESTTAHLQVLLDVPWLAAAAVADKIVAFKYVTSRAATADSPAAFWAQREAFTRLLPYFARIHEATASRIPTDMSAEYQSLLEQCPRPASTS